MEGFGVFLPAFAVCSLPSLDRGRRPLRRFVGMAVVASIRRAEPCRLVGTWYAETVIVPPVDDHIGALRHVAGRAGERRVRAFMAVMGGRRVFLRRVALHADAVAGRAQLRGVRLVAIAAGNAGSEHLALLERAVIVDLILHLTVVVIEPAREGRDQMRVRKPPPGSPVLGELAPTGMAKPAGLDLLAQQRRGEVAGGVPCLRIASPYDIAPFVEANDEALLWVVVFAKGPPASLGARPGDVSGALAMAGLAADVDLGPGAGEAVIRRVVISAHAGRVALRAHEIPVLVQLGPMQNIIVLDLLVRIEVEPALSALLLRAGVPGDRERLQPSVREFDEILLQRIDPEGVFHLERGELAVGAVGLDEIFPVLAKETGLHPVMTEARIVEIAEYRCVGRMIHCLLVLRRAPELRFRGMALGASVAADERERRSGGAEKTRPWRVAAGEP